MAASNDNLHHNETKRQYSAVTRNQSLRPTSNGDSLRVWAWAREVKEGVSTMMEAAADGDETAFGLGCAEVWDAYISFW